MAAMRARVSVMRLHSEKSIGWPKMTMDLPVTKSVDLSSVKPGDKVTLVLKQGRDKQFRVVGIKAAQ